MGQDRLTPLSPTLWRTCRALANRQRLRLLRHVISHRDVSVSVAAQSERMKISAASQYLRALNARGLLRARRRGREVLYAAVHNPSIPETRILLTALKEAFQEQDSSIDRIFRALTAFTHPRRIAMIRAVAGGPEDLPSIRKKTGIPSNAALRHLKKLCRRGCIVKANDKYQYQPSPEPLMRTLTRLVFR